MRTKMTNKLVCPYCGTIQERGLRSIENYAGMYFENKCENCGKDFFYGTYSFAKFNPENCGEGVGE